VIDQPGLVDQTLSLFYDNLRSRFAEINEAGEIGLPPEEIFLEPEKIRGLLEPIQRIEMRSLGKTAAQTDEDFQIGAVPPAVVRTPCGSGRGFSQRGGAKTPRHQFVTTLFVPNSRKINRF
jgi:hypothetical protein